MIAAGLTADYGRPSVALWTTSFNPLADAIALLCSEVSHALTPRATTTLLYLAQSSWASGYCLDYLCEWPSEVYSGCLNCCCPLQPCYCFKQRLRRIISCWTSSAFLDDLPHCCRPSLRVAPFRPLARYDANCGSMICCLRLLYYLLSSCCSNYYHYSWFSACVDDLTQVALSLYLLIYWALFIFKIKLNYYRFLFVWV